MAGAGYKLFNTGDVLTAAQVNTYLNEQTVMVFASSAARTSALSGVLAEGMMSYLQDTNAVEVYNGTSWVNVGNAGDITEVQAGVGISIASGTGPIPVITNSSTDLITTAGDILYGTAADTVARLGIGTAGQVLKVNSGATAPEWGAAGGASGLTLITSTTISSATSKSVDNCFTSTYANYLVKVVVTGGASDNTNASMRFRASGSDTSTNYSSIRISAQATSSTVTADNDVLGTDEFFLGGVDKDNVNGIDIYLSNPQAATQTAYYVLGTNVYGNNRYINYTSGNQTASTQFDGFTLLADNNITGTIRVYGYQNS